ncbi:helix-turn-helix domain-containing protein [Lentzea sp. NBRC 102530]|uniref:helix-turn-helix domain-containing protein n=1 Tax=Lentzea sp. NBRC 102530 TaxID=3032201 RepID=UPI0025579BB2|nr:helix-turn-helix domain-containing protein [Lentzea sp. NBRC 102530]
MRTHGPGRFLGELGLLEGQPSFVTAVVAEPGEVVLLTAHQLNELVRTDPDLGDLVLRTYLTRRAVLIGRGGGLQIVGSCFSPDTKRLLEFAARNRIPHRLEDKFGNLRAWAGPGLPDPYPKVPARRREDLLRRAARLTYPVREKDRLISLVKPHHEVLGVVVLVDPAKSARDQEVFTLEYGTTVLALELAHQRNLAEMELRLHRELLDDLVAGTDNASAYARADALGHDLRGTHHVLVVQWGADRTDAALSDALLHAMVELEWRALCTRRSGVMVVLVSGHPDGEALFRSVANRLGTDTGVVAIGGSCETPDGLPRSFTEAVRTLRIRQASGTPRGVASFSQLGLYRILDAGESRAEVTSFVRQWLGALIDYDDARDADMVRTLSHFLECGGSYDRTASALTIHRSTLRYRLSRMREISGFDLGDVETRLNVHVAARAWHVLRGQPLEGR